jgi:23S rRNA (uridine2552-2'-O)-methyltransferase
VSEEKDTRRRWSGPDAASTRGDSGRSRAKKEPVRKKTLSKSSRTWVERQLADPYVRRAREAGYRARAAFKLKELDEKFGLLRRGLRVADLGCAPGGWLQVVLEHQPASLAGVDLLPVDPLPGVTILQGDAADPQIETQLLASLGGPPDLVLSDMAADTTGHRQTDHVRTMALAELAGRFAVTHLRPGGLLVAKVFQGGAQADLLGLLKSRFDEVRHWKPPASRAESPETYVVATGFRK